MAFVEDDFSLDMLSFSLAILTPYTILRNSRNLNDRKLLCFCFIYSSPDGIWLCGRARLRPRPVDTFIKYYGISGSNEVVDMIISNEDNLVILGNEESSAAGASKDIVILEIDTVNLIKKDL